LGALYCHCKRCQRRTGTAFSASARVEAGSFAITRGEDEVGRWDPGDGGWIKAFCQRCGSQLFTTNPDDPQLLAVRMGAIDGDPGVRPRARPRTAHGAVWEPLPGDGLPGFPGRLGAMRDPAEG